MTIPCPCKSDLSYEQCCQPYHLGHALPAKAQALMRSRYCAFVMDDCHYVFATHSINTRANVSQSSINQWNAQCHWLGLEIIRDEVKDGENIVEFAAWYKQHNMINCHHEISRFCLENVDSELRNRVVVSDEKSWYYVDATYPAKSIALPSRNDLCVCKSGKKFKKCCG